VVRSVVGICRLQTPGYIPVIHLCYGPSRPQDNSVDGRIKLMRNVNKIGNRTRDISVCSVVFQPAAPPRAPQYTCMYVRNVYTYIFVYLRLQLLLKFVLKQVQYLNINKEVVCRARGKISLVVSSVRKCSLHNPFPFGFESGINHLQPAGNYAHHLL
jgi:hypothetical protein